MPTVPGLSQQSIHDAIQTALANDPLPAVKRAALVVHAGVDQTGDVTLTGVLAQRVADHWELSEDVEVHSDRKWQAGVTLVASW